MSRFLMLLCLLCCFAFSTPAKAQGLWFGGFGLAPGVYGSGFSPYGFSSFGFGGPGFYPGLYSGRYTPIALGYPVGAAWGLRTVAVPRPVVVGRPVYAARPAVAMPLNRAYRRIYRRGW
jgi:hypothetical protein